MPKEMQRGNRDMKYGLMANVLPFMLDKVIYQSLKDSGVELLRSDKTAIRREYKSMVKRTPGLEKGHSLEHILYMGCYLLSFYKAFPEKITEPVFKKLIEDLCEEMKRRGKEDDSMFKEKTIKIREEAAIKSQSSTYEMDWKSTFRRVNADNYEFTYTKCGLCELGRRENCLHLIKYLCMTDFVSFDLGGARLERNHTLANGDEYCDFHVFRKEVTKK